jgi:hypothetical protein
MVEGAVLTASPTDAVKFATVLLNSIITKSAQRFSIPGLAGAAGGVTVPATGAQQPKAFVDVARSRVALFFAAASGDSNTSRSLASRAAQITADVLPVDPGHI